MNRMKAAGSSCRHNTSPCYALLIQREAWALHLTPAMLSRGVSRAREDMRSCTVQHTGMENTSLVVPAVLGSKEPFSERRAPLFHGTGRSLVQGVWQQSWPGSRPISPHTLSVKRSGSCILCLSLGFVQDQALAKMESSCSTPLQCLKVPTSGKLSRLRPWVHRRVRKVYKTRKSLSATSPKSSPILH